MSTENVVAWMIEFNDDEKSVTVREDERDLWIHEGYDVTSLVPQRPTLAPEDVRRIAEMLDEAVEASRLLGATQTKKGYGDYTPDDSRMARAMYEIIDKNKAAIIEALGGTGK